MFRTKYEDMFVRLVGRPQTLEFDFSYSLKSDYIRGPKITARKLEALISGITYLNARVYREHEYVHK